MNALNSTRTFSKTLEERLNEVGFRSLPPNDQWDGWRVGNSDEKAWLRLTLRRSTTVRIEFIWAESPSYRQLIELLVDSADDQGVRLEAVDWSKRKDVDNGSPQSPQRITQVLKQYGFRYCLYGDLLARNPVKSS